MKEDGGEKTLCPSLRIPLLPFFSQNFLMEKVLRLEGGRTHEVEGDRGGAGEDVRGEMCWSSCVLAVGGRGLVGIGQV